MTAAGLHDGGPAARGARQELLSAEPTPGGFKTDLRIQVLTNAAGTEYRHRTWAGMKGRGVTGE